MSWPRKTALYSWPLLAALLLAGCGGTARGPAPAAAARGTVTDSVRGAPVSADGVLRPEPGDIWSEGLGPARVPPAR